MISYANILTSSHSLTQWQIDTIFDTILALSLSLSVYIILTYIGIKGRHYDGPIILLLCVVVVYVLDFMPKRESAAHYYFRAGGGRDGR